jgi:hypothetical protein
MIIDEYGLDIFVRFSGGTHIARCSGLTASCTAGAQLAAEAVARKVAAARKVKILAVTRISEAHFIAILRAPSDT